MGRDAARLALAALRALRADLRRGRDRVLRPCRRLVVGDERRAGDRAPARCRAFYLLDEAALGQRVRDRTVAEMVEAAPPEAQVPLADLPFDPPAGTVAAVRVIASITHTIGGVRVDERARVLRDDGSPIEGSGPRASTRAASRRAATRAGSRRRSCSASPRPRTPRARRTCASLHLPTEKAHGRVSPGSGETPILRSRSCGPSSSSSWPTRGELAVAPRAACSPPATRRRGGRCSRPPSRADVNGASRTAGSVTATRVPASSALDARSSRAAA